MMLRMRLTVWRDDEATPILNMPGFVSNGGVHWDAGHDPIIDDDGREVHGICATADVRDPTAAQLIRNTDLTDCAPDQGSVRNATDMREKRIEVVARALCKYEYPTRTDKSYRPWEAEASIAVDALDKFDAAIRALPDQKD